MDKSELKAIVNSEISAAMGFMGGELSEQRAEAMDYYLGEPFGNEMEGRSSVISRDVAETVEWIMPSLMRIFASSDQAVEFEPVGPEDEEKAQQETDYCNHIFYRKNPGFLILYTWFKDALIQKNGIVKPYCEKKEENTKEQYQSLTDDEFALLMADPEMNLVEHTNSIQTFELEGHTLQYPVHDCTFRRIRVSHDKIVANVPPEEFLISSRARSVDPKKAPFVAHRRRVPVSDLIEEGYDKDVLESIPTDDLDMSQESVARKNLTDEIEIGHTSNDKSMRKVLVHECYLKVDYDGDGIAELRKVTMVGDEVLDNEETDRIPFCALTPIILTHKFFGLSIADLVKDLQLIKSTIWRQILDNLYLNNNSMMGVDVDTVNLDDLLVHRPGGKVRVKGNPSAALMPITPGPLPPETFSMIEYIDSVKETRTGVGKQFQGLNADILKEANIPAVQGLLSAAQQRVEMIARIFAETGVKQMFMDLHELVRKYPNKPEVVKLRNKWVPVNPKEFRERTDMTVTVGLGSASKESQLASIQGILADQQNVVANGGHGRLVNDKNIYNALKKKAEISGFKMADMYWQDPDKSPPPSPPPPDPQILAIEAQKQIEAGKQQTAQMKIQVDAQLKAASIQIDQMKLSQDGQIASMKAQLEFLKIASDSASEDQKAKLQLVMKSIEAQIWQMEIQAKNFQHLSSLHMDKYKADATNSMRMNESTGMDGPA